MLEDTEVVSLDNTRGNDGECAGMVVGGGSDRQSARSIPPNVCCRVSMVANRSGQVRRSA